jgi:hypothetical protein
MYLSSWAATFWRLRYAICDQRDPSPAIESVSFILQKPT